MALKLRRNGAWVKAVGGPGDSASTYWNGTADVPMGSPRLTHVPAALIGSPPTPIDNNQFRMAAGTRAVSTTNSNGEFYVSFGTTFTGGLVSCVVSNGDILPGGVVMEIVSVTTSGVTVRVYRDTSISPFGIPVLERYVGPARCNFIAIGW